MSAVLDVFPNVFRIKLVEGGANTWTEAQIPTGLQALNNNREKAQKHYWGIMVLGMYYKRPKFSVTDDEFVITLRDRDTPDASAPPQLDDPGVFLHDQTVFTLATNGILIQERTRRVDITWQGIGRLVIGNNIYMGMQGIDLAGASTVYAQIIYKYIKVPTQEYIDLLNGQRRIE